MISTRGLVNDIVTSDDALDDPEATALFGMVPAPSVESDDDSGQQEEEEEEEEEDNVNITIHSAATSRPMRRVGSGHERRNNRMSEGVSTDDDGRRHHLVISSLSTMLLPEDITLYYNVCIARTLVSPTKGWLSLVSLDLSGCNFNEKILVEKIRQGSKSGKAT